MFTRIFSPRVGVVKSYANLKLRKAPLPMPTDYTHLLFQHTFNILDREAARLKY
ncbi:hypothetical protein OIDMADRAFT_18581 [Oidiodendron maius Zn]|uniref:Uncharacterized protein n=1 Tax=Oidiodendron maius (strain Zn) TaxID=913774 RepID=A0A0C3DI15_OIDMZ|nr:hypothetical protein OIDMADRAFT_18581 [Oidiodendron maius Zn]